MSADESDDGWEEVDVTDALPVESDGDLSLDDLDDDAWSEEVGEDPYSEGAEAHSLGEQRRELPEDDVAPDVPISPRGILEAILFVGTPQGESLQAEEIAKLMRGVRADEIPDLVEELNEQYAEEEAVYEVVQKNGGYLMVLRREYEKVRNRFYGRVKEARLSQAAIDVLALVAYRQPVSRDDVDTLRAKPSGGLLNQLVRRQLVSIEIDKESKKRLYRTTERFLELFGIQDVGELPRSEED